MPPLVVLTLNRGSSSLKFGLYRLDSLAGETLIEDSIAIADTEGEHSAKDMLALVMDRLSQGGLPAPEAITHRIVHGGPRLRQHALINAELLSALDAASGYAPLHMPAALALIRSAEANFPWLQQIVCLDTQFHADLPDVARILPIARELRRPGLERYGFHGLSCESLLYQLKQEDPPPPTQRLLIAHLGNGASVTAVSEGRSIDTSMSLTPSGGLVMGSRSGDLDPGLIFHLLRERHVDQATLESLLETRSGLLGVSGLSSDMQVLQAAAASNADARLAIQMFCSSVRKQLAAMIAVLNGIDLLVFTGGIGEHDSALRAEVISGLSWIGLRLDAGRNRSAQRQARGEIHHPRSRCAIRVMPARENQCMARHTWQLLRHTDGIRGNDVLRTRD